MKYLDNCSKEELKEIVGQLGWPMFRGKQIYQWVFSKSIEDISEMTNLSKEMRQELAKNYQLSSLRVAQKQVSRQENTVKWLLELEDGATIEMVLMRQYYGNSLCISTQAGCAMGCAFCASTLNGLERNLTAGELWGQIRIAVKELLSEGKKLDNLVLMGTGEPLQNLTEVVKFLKNLHDSEGFDFSYRRVTLSTCGLVDGIQKLMEEEIPINLAISLHASTNGVRDKIMPVNQKFRIEELMDIARKYANKTGRRITYEYLLIDGLNDRPEDAQNLLQLIRGQLASVNLIPYNPVEEKSFQRSKPEAIKAFALILETNNIPVSIRKEMGKDIDAACGQLRFNLTKKEE